MKKHKPHSIELFERGGVRARELGDAVIFIAAGVGFERVLAHPYLHQQEGWQQFPLLLRKKSMPVEREKYSLFKRVALAKHRSEPLFGVDAPF